MKFTLVKMEPVFAAEFVDERIDYGRMWMERVLALLEAGTLACLRYALGSPCPRCLGAIQFVPRGCGLCDGRGWVLRPPPLGVVFTVNL